CARPSSTTGWAFDYW
nr:immunoglobulin heavy chain junction region [Macaca mulatta]MOY18252.1 immunoglobulin heavy chain junction region [Macaca mulatta]MOY20327.1 immunoglobulin heavy chain junction region [Macaca mulatta]MOY20480.1 immunoglobulin heavy chain junction region [Macaca mulatta]